MVLTALAIRLIVMVFLLPEQLDPERNHWHMGFEPEDCILDRFGPRFRQPAV